MVAAGVSAQVPADSLLLELETCQRLAQDNYPLVRRYDLIEQARAYDLSHAAKGYLPQLSLSGKATYQSETTELPFDIPGIGHIGLPKDQYQVGIEVQQTVWDGGQIRARKRQTEAASEVDAEKQRVDMYAVRERINQLFFGILLLDEQLRQNDILQDDLKRTYDKVVAYMAHGVANQSDVDAVRVEELNASQQRVSLEVSRRAYIQMLGAFIGQNLPEDVSLRKPVPEQEDEQSVAALPGIARPEVGWLAAQERQIDVQESALKTGYLPRLGVFVQGAYGNPGLNMLKDDFSAWFMAGIRLTWNFGSLYTLKDDRRLSGDGAPPGGGRGGAGGVQPQLGLVCPVVSGGRRDGGRPVRHRPEQPPAGGCPHGGADDEHLRHSCGLGRHRQRCGGRHRAHSGRGGPGRRDGDLHPAQGGAVSGRGRTVHRAAGGGRYRHSSGPGPVGGGEPVLGGDGGGRIPAPPAPGRP